MKNNSIITTVVIGACTTISGMFIKRCIDNKKVKINKLKEKAREYDAYQFGCYLSNEEFTNIFNMLEKYLLEHNETEANYFMKDLKEAREFFTGGSFIYETIIHILNADIPDEDKMKSIRSFITRLDDIMNCYKEYHTRFLNNKKI